MTPSAVRAAMGTALNTIPGLRVFDYVPDTVSPPAAVVEPIEVNFDSTMQAGLDFYRTYVLVIVGRMAERSANDRLDAYLLKTGSTSVKAVLESDQTLGGVCSTCQVIDALPRTVTVSGIEMLAYRFGVEIYG